MAQFPSWNHERCSPAQPLDQIRLNAIFHGRKERGLTIQIFLADYPQEDGWRMIRILVADDDPGIRNLLGAFLKNGGYEVALVNNGIEALESHAQDPVGLVLLDVEMPKMGGLEALRHFKADFGEVPVVLMSGLLDPGLQGEGFELGCADFLSKPFAFSDLLNRVNCLVGA